MRIKVLFLILIVALFGWSRADAGDGVWTKYAQGGVNFDAACIAGYGELAPSSSLNAVVLELQGRAEACVIPLGSGAAKICGDSPIVGAIDGSGSTYTTNVRFNRLGASTCNGGHYSWSVEIDKDSVTCAEGDWSEVTGECEVPPECDAGADLGKVFGKNSDPDGAGSLCMTGYGDGCVAVSLGGGCAGSWCRTLYKLTGDVCAGGETDDGGSAANGKTDCVTQSGSQVCIKPTDPVETVVEGNTVNLDAVVPDGCFQFSSGAVICGDSATSPPAPDNGVTPGTTATPDLSVTNTAGDTVNYYNSTTVNNSQGPVEGTDPSGPTGDGSGNGDGGSECDDADCDGELPGENEEVAGFGDLTAAFLARVEAAPLIAAVDNVQGAAPAGSCDGQETAALAWFGGETLSIDAHCSIWAEIAPLLYNVMLAAWAILGVIIILRA